MKLSRNVVFSKFVVVVLSISLFVGLVSLLNVVNATNVVTLASVPDVVVGSETELLNAVRAAPDNTAYVIGLSKDIVLETGLNIPDGKNITLVSVGAFRTLNGTVFGRSIIEVDGFLTIKGIGVAYVWPQDGNPGAIVVGVSRGGTFVLDSGKISNGNLNGRGGGVNNYGTFVMLGGEISGNAAVVGGGVFNAGNFTMSGGKISNNGAGDGGGVFNIGTFTMSGGEITHNHGGGVYNGSLKFYTLYGSDYGIFNRVSGVIKNNMPNDVYYEDGLSQDDGLFGGGNWWVYLLFIVGVVVTVVGLFFYRVRRRKPLMVNNGSALCFDWRDTYEKT